MEQMEVVFPFASMFSTSGLESVVYLSSFSSSCVFKALIIAELEKIDPEYIGTICGSYRRGDLYCL